MKKNYLRPLVDVVTIKQEEVLAASIVIDIDSNESENPENAESRFIFDLFEL